MTTTQDIFSSGAAPIDERSERAQRAVRAFRAMQPGLSGYARAITGRKEVQVELAQGVPRTDGKKIFFKPPIALGDLTPHDRSKCERRDRKTKLLLCPACRIREEVLITIYHEIAHIVFGTFEPVTEAAKVHAVERAVAEVPGKFAERVREAFKTIPDYKKADYLNLSSLISPYLPVLVNALEDARVDDRMFKARKGTKIMFDAYVQSIFANGVEADDGSTTSWADKPLNSQALIGVFVLACRYSYEGWFHPDVEAALGDARLRELAGRVETTRSAEGTYNLAFPILARLRELGFCKLPEEEPEEEQEPEPEPEEEEQQDEADEDEADDSADEPEDESGDDQEGDPSEGDGGSDAGDGDEPEGADGDAQSDGGDAAGDGSGTSDEDASDSDADSGEDADPRADAGDDGAGEPEPDPDGTAEPSSEEEGSGSRSDGDPEPEGDADGDGSEGHEAGDASESPDSESGEAEDGPDSGESEGGETSGGAGEPDSEYSDRDGEASDGDAGPDRLDEGELTDEDGDPDGKDREKDRDSDAGDSPADEQGLDEAEGDLDDVEVVDSGVDEGEGGTESDRPDYGNPESALNDVQVFGKHEAVLDDKTPAEVEDDKALDLAIIQGQYFEKPSANVSGVREHKYGVPLYEAGRDISVAWTDQYGDSGYYSRELKRLGIDTDLDVPETILGPALNEMRRAFSDNQRAAHEHHLKSGKINARVLGKRAPFGDQRLFQKKRLPGKRSYAVIMGIDISGSTVGVNLALAKRAAMAQAELCARMGIDFAIYAHTANGSWDSYSYSNLWLDVYEIKAFDQPWADKAKAALNKISADAENLDGHGVEYYRRIIERHPATDKIILYYSDGKMPAANHDEELEILQREIAYCKAKQITLLGVGIRTDSPRRHGLDTVQVNDDSDTSKVVKHLQSALLHNR